MNTTKGIGFGVIMALMLSAQVVCGEDLEDAGERYEKGVDLFKAGNYEGALVEFRAAYEAAPHYKVRYNLGVTLYHLHRYVEAREQLEAFIAEGGEDVEQKMLTEAEAILYELTKLIGTMNVTCNVDGAVLFMDGDEIAVLPLDEPVALDVGEYDLEVRAPGYQTHEETVDLAGGKLVNIDVSLSRASEEKDLSSAQAQQCSTSADCSLEGWICHKNECIPKKLKLGRTLLISGAVVGGTGLVLAGVGFLMTAFSVKFGVIYAGYGVGITGLVLAVGSVGLIVPGALMMKRAKRTMKETGSAAVLTPFIAPLPGGGASLGIHALF